MAGLVGAAATAFSGIVVQAAIQPATNVPDDRWSYPWSSAALVPVSLVYIALTSSSSSACSASPVAG